MGPGLGPARAWSEACIIWKALKSLTSEEGPKPGVGVSLTCGKGPKNLSILFSKFKGLSEAWAWNSWKGLSLGPALARLSKPGPVPYF